MVEPAETDEAILACYDVMAELRPHVSREAFLPDGAVDAEGRIAARLHP